MWQFWLIAAGIFFVFEMITVGFLVFWLGVAALITMVVSLFTDSIIIQTAVFVISSILLIFLTKPIVRKFMHSKDNLATNAYSIIGKKGIVTKEINQTLGTGQVTIHGETWSAKCLNEEIIPKGTNITVVKIDGVKAVVTANSETNTDIPSETKDTVEVNE